MSTIHEIADTFRVPIDLLRGGRNRLEFQGTRGPLIGVNGVSSVCWPHSVREYMENNNVGGVLTNCGVMGKGIDYYAHELYEEVMNFTVPVIALCHSAGAFAALRCAELYGWELFKKIITASMPVEGSPYAKLLGRMGKTFKEISPRIDTLREIMSAVPPQEYGRIVSVFSLEDMHVKKRDQRSIPWRQIVNTGAKSHGGTLVNINRHLALILDCELGITASPSI